MISSPFDSVFFCKILYCFATDGWDETTFSNFCLSCLRSWDLAHQHLSGRFHKNKHKIDYNPAHRVHLRDTWDRTHCVREADDRSRVRRDPVGRRYPVRRIQSLPDIHLQLQGMEGRQVMNLLKLV